jgi:hypothetical protein
MTDSRWMAVHHTRAIVSAIFREQMAARHPVGTPDFDALAARLIAARSDVDAALYAATNR